MKQSCRVVTGMAGAMAVAFAMAAGERAKAEEPAPIAAIQALLKEQRLYFGPVDGMEGKATAAAMRRYQMLHGLTATGTPDQPTLATMLTPPPTSAKLTEADREVLRELEAEPAPLPIAEQPREPIPPAPPQAVASPSPTPKGKRDREARKSRPQPRPSRAVGGPRGD